MRRALVVALVIAGCGKVPPPRAHVTPSPSLPIGTVARSAGDAIAYRFVDHAGEATVTSPSLAEAWSALTYPAKLVDPYTGLRGDEVFRVVELALADADVASYGTPHPIAPAKARALRFDPVWNRTRAVYESKRSLFAAGETRYTFAVPPAGHDELQVSLAVAPGGGDVEFVVEVDGNARARRTVPAAQAGAWIALTQPIDHGAHEISLVTHGSSAGFWGDPVIVDRGAGRPAPNVLFVVIDTLRVDALPAMPRLRALAAEGASFTQAITAATWTRPSVLAMLGGDLPTALGQGAEEMIPSDGDRRRFYAVAPPLLPRVWPDAAIARWPSATTSSCSATRRSG